MRISLLWLAIFLPKGCLLVVQCTLTFLEPLDKHLKQMLNRSMHAIRGCIQKRCVYSTVECLLTCFCAIICFIPHVPLPQNTHQSPVQSSIVPTQTLHEWLLDPTTWPIHADWREVISKPHIEHMYFQVRRRVLRCYFVPVSRALEFSHQVFAQSFGVQLFGVHICVQILRRLFCAHFLAQIFVSVGSTNLFTKYLFTSLVPLKPPHPSQNSEVMDFFMIFI